MHTSGVGFDVGSLIFQDLEKLDNTCDEFNTSGGTAH